MRKTFFLIFTIVFYTIVSAQQASTFRDTRDGKTYKTVKIGNQIWMAENLNYTAGNSLCYDNSSSNCNMYGRLYNWNTAQKACPSGWSLPSKGDFETLLSNVGDSGSKAYHALKDGGSSGFSAFFGGWSYDGNFYDIGGKSNWWSASEHLNGSHAWRMGLSSNTQDANINGGIGKVIGASVRCLKDETIIGDKNTSKIEYYHITDPRDGQTYKIITIGNQTWFAENLNFKTNHSMIYKNKPSNGERYGRIYEYRAAIVACPTGWHLPSDDEWIMLEVDLGMSQSAADESGKWRGTTEGEKLKSTAGWLNDGNGNNSSGFNGLPGGYGWSYDHKHYGLGTQAFWWTSDAITAGNGATSAKYRFLNDEKKQIKRSSMHYMSNLSVRCIRDEGIKKNANSKVEYFQIKDSDGWSNMRKSPGGEIIRKVYPDEKFIIVKTQDNYKYIEFPNGEKGYIHESRVFPLK